MKPSTNLSHRRRSRRPDAGLTLIEILVVLAILGLLVGVLVTKTDKIFGSSQEAVAGIFVRESVKIPLTTYKHDIGDYPSTVEGMAALLTAPPSRAERWRGPYLETTGAKLPLDPWNEPYQYRYPGVKNPGSYDLSSKGPDHQADTADDIGNW